MKGFVYFGESLVGTMRLDQFSRTAQFLKIEKLTLGVRRPIRRHHDRHPGHAQAATQPGDSDLWRACALAMRLAA